MRKREDSLADVIRTVIERKSLESRINASWVANEAYLELDPDSVSPAQVKLAALAGLTQLARTELRIKLDPTAVSNPNQAELFPGLQTRYPAAHTDSNDEASYVDLEHMTAADVEWNAVRMRKTSKTLLKHADALEEWAIGRGLIDSKRQAA